MSHMREGGHQKAHRAMRKLKELYPYKGAEIPFFFHVGLNVSVCFAGDVATREALD